MQLRFPPGVFWGLLGIVGFSLTLPATRLAMAGFDPVFVALGRALVAALIGAMALWLTRAPRPRGRQWGRLAATASGVVIGFPLFSTLALKTVPISHGAVVVALTPLSTALFGAWLAHERPRLPFWISLLVGTVTLVAFSLYSSGSRLEVADFFLLAAVISVGFGYAEGARLSKELGAWQTISWALLVSAPVLLLPAALTAPRAVTGIGWAAWAGFGYVSVISMFLAFVAWYRGLAQGGIARIGQLQLLQPLMTLLAAALLLGETIALGQVAVALVVLACVAVGRRFSVSAPAAAPSSGAAGA